MPMKLKLRSRRRTGGRSRCSGSLVHAADLEGVAALDPGEVVVEAIDVFSEPLLAGPPQPLYLLKRS